MPLSLVDFWKRLIQSGLADASVPKQWAAEFADEHESKPPSDPVALTRWLVKKGKLSPLHAKCLLAEADASMRFPVLRIAPFVQAAERAPAPFSRWTAVDHDSYPDDAGVLLQIVPSQLTPADGDCLRTIAGLAGPGVPEMELAALSGGPLGTMPTTIPLDESLDVVGLFAKLPTGKMLSDQMRSGAEPGSATQWTVADIALLIDTLSKSLSAFAAQADGELAFPPMPSPDRIWVPESDSGTPLLWIDPADFLSPEALGSQPTIATAESRLLYAAPEVVDSVIPISVTGVHDAAEQPVVANRQSLERQAVYALGCLAYRLRFGQHAFAAAKEEQIRSRQLRFEPPELTEAVSKGAAGDPLLRVLAYALVKDPDERFPSLDAFATALNAAVRVVKEPAEAKPPAEPVAERKNHSAAPKVDLPVPAATPAQTPKVTGNSQTNPVATKETAAAPKSTPKSSSKSTPKSKTKSTQKSKTKKADTTPKPDSASKPDARKAEPSPPVIEERQQRSEPADSAKSSADQATGSDKEHSQEVPAQKASSETPVGVPSPQQTAAATVSARAAASPVSLPPRSRASRVRSGRRRTAWYVLGSMWVPIFLLILAIAFQDPNEPPRVVKRTRPPIPAVIPSVTGRRPTPPTRPTSPVRRPPRDSQRDNGTIELVSDPTMLWASPSVVLGETKSDATLPPTALLPPGPAAVLTFDINRLLATGLRDVFDPELGPLIEQFEKRTSMTLGDVRMLSMAWFPGKGGVPEVAMAVHLRTPQPIDQLTEAWDVSIAQLPGGIKLYAGDDPDSDAFYPHFVSKPDEPESQTNGDENAGTEESPASELVDAFAIGSITRTKEVAEVEGAPVLLPRLLEELWESAEPNDAITLLTQPNFLIADARTWVDGTAPTLLSWVQSTLIPECGGILVRVASVPPSDAGEDSPDAFAPGTHGSFVEVHLAAAPSMDPEKLKSKVRARLEEAPSAAEDFLVTREVDPSWRLLAARLPSMWAFVGEQTRSASIKREVIFNTYLPPLALPQVALGTLLAANTTTTSAMSAATESMEKLTLAEMLDRPMSVSFGQESLQFAVDTIINEFAADLPKGNSPPKVEIIGGDLQLMGITQNQQVRDFAKDNLPLRRVLTDLVLGANPDRTATGPNDPKQALLWVVVGEGEEAEIRITTREAAANKGYTLPDEFKLDQ
ncbi:MAG: serine/threonine protein kinase [Rhodopirellula sp. JB044]|uniref:serine/threonine protein kinase n=1 Tax=Rhodopirellula sp. JB044 TaxID=3342844 RepID=UPI00370BFF7B